MKGFSDAFTPDFLISAAVVAIILLMFGLIINLYSELSTLKTRYKRMMEGAEGSSIEQMLKGHMSDIDTAINKYRNIEQKLESLDDLVHSALTRVAVIHFDAFEKTGQGLSWCIALLDRNDNGVVLSSICGKESARCYAKPIENGRTSERYKLTREEEQVLRQAMRN